MQKTGTEDRVYINAYSAISSIGDDISTMFKNAINEDSEFLTLDDSIVKGSSFYFGKIKTELPRIQDFKYNLRCNRILLHCYNQIKDKIDNAIKKYGKTRVGVVIGTTNSGVDEYALSGDIDHSQIGNPAGFLHKYLALEGYFSGVSTACTSGIKAFSTAQKLLENNICDAVIAGAVDALCKMPVFGFHSLEVLSDKPCLPFSKNRNGINIGEGGALFLVEKEASLDSSISILAIGESSDAYHCATPDPEGVQAAKAMEEALHRSGLKSTDINYINLHGTATITNDLMEANAVYKIFKNNVPVSSTKSQTGHCLGAAAAIEAALCCAMLDNRINKENKLLPHKFDGVYDDSLPVLSLVKYGQTADNIKYVMNNAFGFGGSNAVMILGKAE